MKADYSSRQHLLLLAAAIFGPVLILLIGITWRLRWEGIDKLKVARQVKGQVLFSFYHSRLLGLCYSHRFRNIGIMVSKSFDGEWIARIVTNLGYRVFRGSASRNGAPALIAMLHSSGGDLALTVDGPRGPAEQVKPGIIALAAHSGLPIVPISYQASTAWRLKSWDRLIIPKPLSVVTIKYGEMVTIPDNPDTSEWAMKLKEHIDRLG